jgi:hypothetical protein
MQIDSASLGKALREIRAGRGKRLRLVAFLDPFEPELVIFKRLVAVGNKLLGGAFAHYLVTSRHHVPDLGWVVSRRFAAASRFAALTAATQFVKGAPLGIKMLGPRLRLLEQRTALPPQKPTDAFYSTPEWRALLAEIIAERGRVCEDPNCERTTPLTRIFGDHIVELRDGGTQLDKRNVMLRCGSCHTRKTVAERARRTAARV